MTTISPFVAIEEDSAGQCGSGKAGSGIPQDSGAAKGKRTDREGLGIVTEIGTSVLTARSCDSFGGGPAYGNKVQRSGVCGTSGQDVATGNEEVGWVW